MASEANHYAIDPALSGELQARLRGHVIDQESPQYEQTRKVWNGSIDRHPALIARCAGVADVIETLKFAESANLPVAVRGGGHSFPGLSVLDDGLVIDLSSMKGIRVDPIARTAHVQAGVLLGELDHETQAFGMVVPAGIVTHTGIAGLTLGGGIGWTMRKLGLTVDQLISADVVTADGSFVKANATENADLFWGLRGAGSNFGVVTEFEFRLNPLGPMVLSGPIYWPMEDSPKVLRFYREWLREAPDELMTIVIHRKAPAVPTIPTEMHGRPVVAVICCYPGEINRGEAIIQPLRSFGTPLLDQCAPRTFLAHQAMFDPSFETGWWYYFRACDVVELSDPVIDITVEHSMKISSPTTSFPIWQMGGAVARVDDDEMAFSGRRAGYTFNIGASTKTAEGFETEREWVKNFWSALAPYHMGVYSNFLMDEGVDRVKLAYGERKYERLRELKKKYDPKNVFKSNQNIPPAESNQ